VTVLIASDLDRTLIYSAAGLGAAQADASGLTCVELYAGQRASFMTIEAARILTDLAGRAELIPVTTRTPAQFARVQLPSGPSGYAVTANGGVLLVDGQADAAWTAQVTQALAQVAGLAEVWQHLSRVCDPAWTHNLRNAEELFCYAVIDRARLPAAFLSDITAWAADRGWTTSLQGRKLYWVPRTLTKAAAVEELARRIDAQLILGAGDSLLDIDLLMAADRGIHPAHGEIAESGWQAPHVQKTTSIGGWAGEDICRWFADQLAVVEADR
jgi:hypothetical protein